KGLKEGKWKSVSEHPNAQEVVMFSYENRYGTWTGLGTIDKDRSKGITDEVEMKHIEQSTGILTNFINIKVLLGGADE
ncbi:hypothetical protein GTO27_04695, partial [Candidatus Bathyarchaeota archaeon]|nr:hypothetical protein [Candidatus Bathyarchaeota archaeon]